ncbi:MAG: hypothetical protein GY696_09900 [Gammaproteobacteria bacterium]|nr:hypothetical protein [Gammaproteobacteria bacterium]
MKTECVTVSVLCRLKFSIPAAHGPGPSALAPPLQALFNRFMQPTQSSAGSTPPAGASPRLHADSPPPEVIIVKSEETPPLPVLAVPPVPVVVTSQPMVNPPVLQPPINVQR